MIIGDAPHERTMPGAGQATMARAFCALERVPMPPHGRRSGPDHNSQLVTRGGELSQEACS
jgi:hypothetical protein